MENELVKVEQSFPVITAKEIDDFLFASGTKLTDQQKAMFFQMAHINGLNPFRREIYAVPYENKTTGKVTFNIITGYEVYLKRAERSGKLDGWEADYKTDSNGDYAYCTIYRKDWSKPITQKVWLSEFKQNNKMWNEKSKTMLIKVAIATAFRRAFPEEIGGLPYTTEEMPMEAEIVKDIPGKTIQETNFKDTLIKSLCEQKGYDLKGYLANAKKQSVSELSEKVKDKFIEHLQAIPDKPEVDVPAPRSDDEKVPCPKENGEESHTVKYCREMCMSSVDCEAWK